MMEDPRKWKTTKTTWKTRTTRTTRTSWTSAPYNCTTTPGYFRYYHSGKHIWYSWQLQLARAQDQTNRYLQEHLQQGQMNMQAHTGAVQQLATSTYQWNFDHIFASIPIYDGSDCEGFFPWLE